MLQSRVLVSLMLAGTIAGAPLSAVAQVSGTAAGAKAPLPAAGAAGIKQAQGFGFDDIPWVFVVGGSLVLTAVILGLTDDDPPTSTTATN